MTVSAVRLNFNLTAVSFIVAPEPTASYQKYFIKLSCILNYNTYLCINYTIFYLMLFGEQESLLIEVSPFIFKKSITDYQRS